jgi:peptide/nickel transport system substrate-binding protein
VGCGPSGAHHRRDPGALVVAQAADVVGLDPIRVTDSESVEAGELVFEGLVGWKPGTTDLEPRLATAWELSRDGMAWTFHLREGVTFHDGTPFDASAVVFSFERLLDPRHPFYVASEEASYWRTLLAAIDKVTAIDPRTVEIRVARPHAPLIAALAMFPIVSPAAVQRWGDAFATHPVGTGPFAFTSWRKGEGVAVHRFDGYWGTPAALSQIVFEVVVDARQRLIDLESGSVDLAVAILPDEQAFVELHPDLVLARAAGNNVAYLAFNTQKPPFDDVRVRRAANYAINKEPIIKLAYQGRATTADGPLTPGDWAYHAPATSYRYDPEAARKLLAEAASDGRIDLASRYRMYVMTTPRPYLPQPERVARFLQAALEQVGLQTELVLQDTLAHSQAVEAGEHDLAVFGWVGDTGDPDNFLYVLFDSDNARPGRAQNVAFYRQPQVDTWLAAAQVASDQEQRARLYAEVQDQIALDAPWVPLAHSEHVVAARAELAGIVLSPTGHPVYPLIRRAEPR